MGALLAMRKRATDSLLLLCYCSAAWLMAILIDPQAGGTINYFWEPLVVSAVLAGPGLCEFQSKVEPHSDNGQVISGLCTAAVGVLSRCFAGTTSLLYLTLCRTNISQYHARKARWEAFVSTVSGRRLLSTSSDVALLSSTPEMPDPFPEQHARTQGRSGTPPPYCNSNRRGCVRPYRH